MRTVPQGPPGWGSVATIRGPCARFAYLLPGYLVPGAAFVASPAHGAYRIRLRRQLTWNDRLDRPAM